ncbi:inner membrane protein YiaA [Apibacter sp. HY039]|uniref:inner membrane protein YiaA n=1 Tax=Apibacter sp. HY039 TaxID=2501476 RepID=UPI000FEB62F9|nr:inner membrane protein YiaA [Apibacter sp. HY039]
MENKQTSIAFAGASWVILIVGVGGYLIGLWRAEMELNEKGYYLLILLYGLFSGVSIQKSVRDRLEGIPVTDLYYGLSWASLLASVALLTIGLINADLLPSEKGFYAFGFILALFGAICVQKNTRDAEFENKKIFSPQTKEE